jgi:hypothetical protein
MAFEKINISLKQKEFTRPEVNKYISRPEQLLALRVARELGDEKNKALYLHLCKHLKASLIEQVLSFVVDARARDRGRLFSWKLKQLRQEWEAAGKNPRRQPLPPPTKLKTLRVKKPTGQQLELFAP